MELFRTILVCLLAIVFLAVVTPAKHHRHHREYDDEDDDDSHYLPPESHELKPYFRKDKQTSEHVTYHHKDKEEHYEPKRVDHYHHYDKKPEVKTKHIHYQQPIPQVREILTPAPSQIVTRRRRPNRVLYATAPNSVFHTQINVQSQDSELNSQIRPDPLVPAGQLPGNGQAPTGGQLGTSALPNCQFPVAGNAPVGCRVFDPLGDQLGTGALPPGAGQLPGNGLAPGGGQLPTNGLAPGGGQFPTNGFAPAPGGQLPANGFANGGGQQPANGFQAGGQLGNGNNFFVDPSQGAQLGAGQGVGNGNQNGGFGQNLFVPANGGQTITQRPSSVLIQFDPAFGGQLPASAQAPAAGNPFFGAQLGTGQAPAPQQQFPANQAPFNPVLGGQLATGAQAPANGNGNPVFGGQLPTSAQAPGNGNPSQFRLNPRRRQRNRSNYQGLNVVRGNVFGQPDIQGPTNAIGNQQDTNIIDGNFYSSHSGHHKLQRINGNQRSVILTDDDYYDDDDVGTTTDLGAAGSAPELIYAKPEHKGSRHKDQEASASEHHETEYHDDGYHYKNPRRTK